MTAPVADCNCNDNPRRSRRAPLHVRGANECRHEADPTMLAMHTVKNTKGTSTMTAPTTLADLLAAVELGAIDPSTPVVPESDLAERIMRERADAAALATVHAQQSAAAAVGGLPAGMVAVVAGQHDCGISGCRHGDSHTGATQPDRQAKLVAPCGAVARMTGRALALAGGAIVCSHGDSFTIDSTRRTYNRK